MLTLIDHILASLLIVVLPLYATFEYRRLKARRARLREQGLPADNVPEYRWTIALQWGLTAAMTGIWLWQSRAWSDLGLVVPPERSLWNGWGFAAIAALTLVAVILLLMQVASIRRSANTRENVRKQIVSVRDMLPSTPRELHWFYALSVTAGICEELLYRGFMLWYLSHAMSIWAAVPLSALIFGIAHAYQGASGIAKTGPVGLIMAAMYVVSGSLWLPMMLHAAIDILNGRMIFDALTMDGDTPEKAAGGGEPAASPRYDQPHASAGPSAA